MFLPPYPSSTLVHPVVCNCLENFRGIPNWLQMCKDAHHRPLHQEDDITLHASFKSSSFNTELGDTIVPDSQCACGEWWDYNSSWQCSVPRNLTALFSLEFPLPLWSHLILNLFYGFLTLLMYYSSLTKFYRHIFRPKYGRRLSDVQLWHFTILNPTCKYLSTKNLHEELSSMYFMELITEKQYF